MNASRKLLCTLSICLLMLIAQAIATTAQAQFGGGGGGGGLGGGFSLPGDGGIMIEPSASGKTLYGYSDEVGEWDKLVADPHPVDGLSFVLSNNLGVVRSKGHVHAFGVKYGKWISIETDGDPGVPVLSAGAVGCVAGTHLYGIGPISGRAIASKGVNGTGLWSGRLRPSRR